MIKVEHIAVTGWEAAIRGMRNPKNSWDRIDSYPAVNCGKCGRIEREGFCEPKDHDCSEFEEYYIGPNDEKLMKSLIQGGPVHAKFRRMIIVTMDITAPLYWWKEFDTYKVGTVANSCSTMHKIHAKEFTLDDFSHEYLIDCERYAEDEEVLVLATGHVFDILGNFLNDHPDVYCGGEQLLHLTINTLNFYRERFNQIGQRLKEDKRLTDAERKHLTAQQKRYWWQLIQLLPSSYNQKRTVQLSYETLANMVEWRSDHKLDEWRELMQLCRTELPHSWIFTKDRGDDDAN